MGGWSGAGAGADAAPEGGASSDGGAFCATQANALFCADFDEDTTVDHGWSYPVEPKPQTTVALETQTFTSPPHSALMRVDPGASDCKYATLAEDVPSTPASSTLSFDVRAGEVDGGGIGNNVAPITRERLCVGANCSSCANDRCPGTAICYLMLETTADESHIHEQVFPADGGSAIDNSHPFRGAHLAPGAWARVSIAVDSTRSPSSLRVTLSTDGGSPLNVVDDTLDPACSGATLRGVFIGFTCAPTNPGAQIVRFDDIVLN